MYFGIFLCLKIFLSFKFEILNLEYITHVIKILWICQYLEIAHGLETKNLRGIMLTEDISGIPMTCDENTDFGATENGGKTTLHDYTWASYPRKRMNYSPWQQPLPRYNQTFLIFSRHIPSIRFYHSSE
jgi:hypothetical protein